MEKGTLVKMSEEFKAQMINSESKEHIEEFGECIGVVLGKVYPDLEDADEIDVRWYPSNLKYAYYPNNLTIV